MIPSNNDPKIDIPDLYITASDARTQSINNAEVIANENRNYKRKFLFEKIHEAIKGGQTELMWHERPNHQLLTELKDKGFSVSEIETPPDIYKTIISPTVHYSISWE